MGHFTLDCPVPRESREEILNHLYFVDAGVEALEFDPADERVVRYLPAGDAEPPDLGARLKQAADRLARSIRMLPRKVRYRSAGVRSRGCAAPYAQLLERGWVKPVAGGAHAYCGLMRDLYAALDAEFRRQAMALDVEEYLFPSLIDLESLHRAGYLESFPHQVNFLCHLPEQMETVARYKARMSAAGGRALLPLADLAAEPACAMCPTVCYHFYGANAGQTLVKGVIGATAVSPCYRYEGRPTTGLRRLREFTMREIMFLGAAEEIRRAHASLMACITRMLGLCELQSVLQTAADPFFPDEGEKKRFFQMSFDLKYEARAYLPGDDLWLAIGSVNHHQDHFGRAFDIALASGDPACSCCLGFGLDRWCMAVFAQHGLEPAEWPAGLSALLADCGARDSARSATRGEG